MRILVVSQYFWPETFIINDLARNLSKHGHQLTVVTGKPNYPEGIIYDGYQSGGVQRDQLDEHIDIIRVPLWPRGSGGSFNLMFNYLSFVLSGLFLFPWLLRKQKFDVIFVFAPSPITQVIPAIPLKWLKKAHLAVWVQDLWPESLAATGFVKHQFLLKAVGGLVRAIYSHCDTLLVQSKAFVEPIAHYARRDKVVYYPNSIDVQHSSQLVNTISPDLAGVLDQYFSVVFAGNIGTAQSVETLLEAAVLLREDPAVRLVFVGSGSRLAWLQTQKESLQLDNLVLPGRFPIEVMPQIFARADALLVSLRDETTFSQTIPSKVQAYLAAGRPIIASLRGEGAQVVMEAGAGKVCEPDDPDALAALICAMKNLPEDERQAMGRAGRAFFYEHFEMNRQVTRLVEILEHRRKE